MNAKTDDVICNWKIVNTLLNLLMGKGCVSQILLGPFLNTWIHISLSFG